MKTRKFLKGRVTALLLVLCMIATLLPAMPLPALAADHDHSNSNWIPITMGETYIEVGVM